MNMATFDADKALDQIEGDKEGLSILFATFKQVSVNQIEEIREAIQQRDADKLASVAHCFKSSLGVFAAEPAAEIVRKIEVHARDADFDGAQKALVKLAAECSRLENDLGEFLQSDQGAFQNHSKREA